MATTTWQNTNGGSFNTAADWSNGVPALGSTALITATGAYTVTSSQNNTLSTLDMASGATLDINGGTLALTLNSGAGALGGQIAVGTAASLELGTSLAASTVNNTGTITDESNIVVNGIVTLIGDGTIAVNSAAIVGGPSPATLINSGNTITVSEHSGLGDIGGASGANLNFVNGTKGVVEAESGGVLRIDTISFQNSGLIEAAAYSGVFLESNISQTTTGKIAAVGAGNDIFLESNTSIIGGAVSIASGGSLYGDPDTLIEPAKAIANAGTIEQVSGGTLFIEGSVKNASTGILEVGGSSIDISGTVTKGTAEISDTGSITFGGPSSANVTFGGGTDELVLDDATKFTGTVAGMSGNPDASIDLENIAYSDVADTTANFNAKTHLLTVTDTATKVTDKIKISGTLGTIAMSGAADGSLLISDPASASAPQSVNIPLFTNFVASAFSSAGQGDGSLTAAALPTAAQELALAPPQHG